MSVPKRVDFSRNSEVYDQRHGATISGDLAQLMAGLLPPGATVIDIGAGTGRVAVPLAERGLRVVAIDPAIPMLQTILQKSGATIPVCAEGNRLPLRGKSADAVVAARLMYLAPAWQGLLAEAKETLRTGGILFHEWGNGESDEKWVQIREKARSLFEAAGVATPFHPGARSEAEVDAYIRSMGFVRKQEIVAGSGPWITLGVFLDKIQSGEFSYIWSVPKEVQESCLPQLRRWSEENFDLSLPAPMPAELRWVAYERSS